jgi:disulfide bond formation protein DsbB
MFENEVQTRCAICGTGILLGLVLVLAHLPVILLVIPVIILFLGIIADPEETHAVWYGMLNTLGIFELPELTDIERLTYAEKRHYFWFGEVEMAAMLAGTFAAPVGIYMAGRTDTSLAFIGAAVLFLPLFVFLPKLIQRAMKADTDAAIEAFGKNEQVKKVFWTLFISMSGLVLARVLDPATAQQIVGLITGIGI